MAEKKSLTDHIPNIITLLNMATGFTAIIIAIGGNLRLSAFMVLLAVLLDFLDGLAARMLKAASPLGRELDSLSDLVSFGAAPAVLMYYILSGLPVLSGSDSSMPPGPLMEQVIQYSPVLLVVAGGYRLARFNITHGTGSFTGLPIPATGIFIAGLILIISAPSPQQELAGFIRTVAFCLVSISVLSLLMISKIPLMSLKTKDFRLRGNLLRYILLAVSVLLIIFLHEMAVALIIIFYLLFSLISLLIPSKEIR